MQSKAALPSQAYVWTVVGPRIEEGLSEQKLKILELCGLYNEFGPPGDGFTGDREGDETIIELAGLIVVALCRDMAERIASARAGRKAGRPCDILTRELGPPLLSLFLRCHHFCRPTVGFDFHRRPGLRRMEAGTVLRVCESRNRSL